MVKIPKKSDVDLSVACDSGTARYPYGTELCLHDELIDLLGIGDLEVDQVVTITAVAHVSAKRMRSSTNSNGESYAEKSIDLQLTELSVRSPVADVAQQLYGRS